MWEGLLPIGSIVKLKNLEMLVMIMGVWQTKISDETAVYDYAGVTYPHGYINRDLTLGFDREDIEDVLYIGYMDYQQQFFMERIEPILDGLKAGEITQEEATEMAQNAADEIQAIIDGKDIEDSAEFIDDIGDEFDDDDEGEPDEDSGDESFDDTKEDE
ncbi:DUF4176 domain-containing protein [Butyrivibrio sp. JL13D10]|uniref:DUF4176 domain-containing protein n=1 Tax=Butyrivibrio sp. JL13D10 TaxID=3236815 RepID=UPI0038B486BD